MRNGIRKFSPSANGFTLVLLTIFVATFGIFAQTSASECIEAGIIETSNSNQALVTTFPCENESHSKVQSRPNYNY
jgi:hypothetical protein